VTAAGCPIVGIGASAGGLEACRKLLSALPANSGMAFILVLHLDPTHESLMVDLLASHTAMTVRQAAEGMRIEPDHLYVIPPGVYLSVVDDALRLSEPEVRHGARLPFDFLLRSLAADRGQRAMAVILSGSGTDGNLGLKAVKEKGGLVIAQTPDEAGHDGMPRSAMLTGAVDMVLPVAEIPDALIKFDRRMALSAAQGTSEGTKDWLPEVIELLRTKTVHDFTLYKQGTLRRRIERRMAMAAVESDEMARYLDQLRSDPGELELLAKDLLINVTSFFRDPQVFDLLGEKIIPELIAATGPGHAIRIWIAGCSTGEETYSLAMLFRERIAAAGGDVKLQIFASDVDSDAVAFARDGLYPEMITAEVTQARLDRFFSKEPRGYRVSPELRGAVVFTVQDVLADPPFSNIDLVSCRNLLIYLRPEAQAKVISVFHFALRERGILVLGSSEAITGSDDRFEVISKPERLYRHIGRGRPGEFGFSKGGADGVRVPPKLEKSGSPSRQAAIGELCQRLLLDIYAPAAVLINGRNECLYSLGPTDRYLRMPPGSPTHDLLAMARPSMRPKLRSAIQRSTQENARVAVSADAVNIEVRPVPSDGESLRLVCFADEPKPELPDTAPLTPNEATRLGVLEKELEVTRAELQTALHTIEVSVEERSAANEEALSVQEEYQSTNEELLTSKEELQSLNEELTALNSQLLETLERQRTTANDLQNVLYSTDVATIFLDGSLNIRLYTPATKALFGVIPSDIGRPLADLNPLSTDTALLDDARMVLRTIVPVEREVETDYGAWFIRRILPYRTPESGAEGVVITFTDITERRQVANELEATKRLAELANAAKSRFLAAASHDLRQPLQTLTLLQGMLAIGVTTEKERALVGRIGETLGTITDMLNTLLDIDQIETGRVKVEIVEFPIADLFDRLKDEFSVHAEAQGLGFRVVPCRLAIRSDPRLFEQMLRNLLSNALKYTPHGKVLLGCRRRGGHLDVEVWDTGIGIADGEQLAIFTEYHQVDNDARQRSRGLGLGLSIVQRLGVLLDHRIRLRSHPGKGSVFAIEVAMPRAEAAPRVIGHSPGTTDKTVEAGCLRGEILIVEDDPEVRELLQLFLTNRGHRVSVAADGLEALDIVARGIWPDLILADYNLPNGLNGVQVATKLRENLEREIPVIILTGDITTDTLRDSAMHNCVQINKPVSLVELTQVIQRLFSISPPVSAPTPLPATKAAAGPAAAPVIFVIDDDSELRVTFRALLEANGWIVEDYETCEAFLKAYRPGRDGCLLIDAKLPGMSGLDLLRRLKDTGIRLPSIMITGNGDVAMAVEAMKAGAQDFIEKPVSHDDLLAFVTRALERARDSSKQDAWRENAAHQVAGLTPRQREIMELVLAGHPSKNIAADLGISQRTVENHRASIMKKTGSKSLPALARLAVAAS